LVEIGDYLANIMYISSTIEDFNKPLCFVICF
jgi:hypothetical protein